MKEEVNLFEFIQQKTRKPMISTSVKTRSTKLCIKPCSVLKWFLIQVFKECKLVKPQSTLRNTFLCLHLRKKVWLLLDRLNRLPSTKILCNPKTEGKPQELILWVGHGMILFAHIHLLKVLKRLSKLLVNQLLLMEHLNPRNRKNG